MWDKVKSRVKCNCCEKYFNIKIKEKNCCNNFAVKIKYFTCPKCGANYLVEIENDVSRALKGRRRKCHLISSSSNSDDEYEKLKLQIKENENQLREQCKEMLVQEHFINV